jgi:hypothetical protein
MIVEIPSRVHRPQLLGKSSPLPPSTPAIQPPQLVLSPTRLPVASAKEDRALNSSDVLALLDRARILVKQLPSSVPEWDASEHDTTCIWDGSHPEDIPTMFEGGGADRDEDWEQLDPVLNRVLHVNIPIDVVASGIRRGSRGTSGIIDGLAFFVEKRNLNPVYFGTKLQRLVEALELRIK